MVFAGEFQVSGFAFPEFQSLHFQCGAPMEQLAREQYNRGTREVLLYRGEDDMWVAECPSLPGCVSQGATKPEAIANIKEAIEGYVLALQEDGLPIPEERFDAMVVAV